MKPIPLGFLVGVLTATVVGCTSGATPNSGTANASPSSSTTTAAPQCAGAQFTTQQFVGDWKDQDGTDVVLLNSDGTLTSHDGQASGTWSYLSWEDSPAKNTMPASAAGQCVLALSYTGALRMNAVYAPLKVTDTTLTLSYIGRGNTITWVRAANSQ